MDLTIQDNPKRSFRPALALLGIPLLLLGLVVPITQWRGAYYASTFDPEYAYLMNSMSVMSFHVPWHRDHPGTTVQSLGALTARFATPSLSRSQVISEVAKNPEHYLKLMSFVLFTLCSLFIFFAGLIVARSLASVSAGVLFQLVPFFSITAWSFVGRFTPDPLILAVGIVTASVTLALEGAPLLIALAILFGFAMATKITAIPLVILPCFFLEKTRRNIFAFATITGTCFLFFALPLLFKWKESVAYILLFPKRVALAHSEGHFISFGLFLERIFTLWRETPLIPVAVFCAIGLWLTYNTDYEAKSKRRALALLTVLLAQSAYVATNPAPRYLLPAYGVAALILTLAYEKLSRRLKGFSYFSMICACLLFSLPLWSLYPGQKILLQRAADELTLRETMARYNCREIYIPDSLSPENYLRWGNGFTDNLFSTQLTSTFPKTVFMLGPELFKRFDESTLSRKELIESGQRLCLRTQSTQVADPSFQLVLKPSTADALFIAAP